MDKLKLAKNGYLTMSIICYIAGTIYILIPRMEPLAVCVISGIALIIYGIIKIIGYFAKDLYCLAFQYDLACGLLLITLGIIVLARNLNIVPYLSPGLGLLILMDSVLAVQMSKDAKQFGLETWNVILTTSIVAGVFGALLIIRPYHSRFVAHIVAGGALITAGLKNHCVMTYAVKATKVQPPHNPED